MKRAAYAVLVLVFLCRLPGESHLNAQASYIPLSTLSRAGLPCTIIEPYLRCVPGEGYRITVDVGNTADIEISFMCIWSLLYFPDRTEPVLYEYALLQAIPPDSSVNLFWDEPENQYGSPVSGMVAPRSVEFTDGSRWDLYDCFYENLEPDFLLQTNASDALAGDVAPHTMLQERSYTAETLSPTPPEINGDLNDDAWNSDGWSEGFIQREPSNGAEPSQETAFKSLYDTRNIYIAVRAYDTDSDPVERRSARRDGIDGDWIEANLDSYNDKRTAFRFYLSVAGIKGIP